MHLTYHGFLAASPSLFRKFDLANTSTKVTDLAQVRNSWRMLVSDRVLKLEGNKTNYVLCNLQKTDFKIGYFVTADGLNSNQVSQKVINEHILGAFFRYSSILMHLVRIEPG